ncbi:unnamed protein product [Cuscuta epithymum]|uniref:Uncharacterized protein n=1 Tax=Cuscuta epithymum TaxID=186058 RepID=A0AAV0CWT2_9ASTE|nr:unnamed protein product [Cuscuta epithymum]
MTSMYSKEDEEALFRNYPRAALPYFGQHPAHANNNKDKQEDQDHENDDEGDNADVELDHDQYNYGWGRLLSIGYPDSGAGWIAIQISWRVVVSMAAALLVFYITTKPPPPKVSVKMVGLEQWELGEGVDGSGVNSKILNCNASINLVIENKSNLFPLHIHPPLLQMYFGRFLFATSKLKIYKTTTNKQRGFCWTRWARIGGRFSVGSFLAGDDGFIFNIALCLANSGGSSSI